MMQIIPSLVSSLAQGVLREMMKDPQIPVTQQNVQTYQPQVERIVERVVRNNPEIQHITSTEPSFWQSRANVSTVISLVAPVAAVVGYNIAPEYQEAIAGSIWLIGNLVAAYFARRARTATRPLGA